MVLHKTKWLGWLSTQTLVPCFSADSLSIPAVSTGSVGVLHISSLKILTTVVLSGLYLIKLKCYGFIKDTLT